MIINGKRYSMQESFTVEITEEMQETFTKLSGDVNPLHLSNKFAKQRGFSDKLVFGMLTASFFSKLVGVYLPGKNCLFQECKDIRFHSPVFVGNELTVKGEITEIDERFGRLVIKATIHNQENKKVCSAKLMVGVL